MNKNKVILPCLGLLHALSAGAATSDKLDQLLALSLEDLMAINVSIATQTPKAFSRAPAAVSVITAEDLKATGATNLTEALQSVPGLYVRTTAFGFRPLVQFRGASATQAQVMVNGTPQRDLMWGSGIFWKGLPAEIVDRIEIIRGPGSALFGADAMAGAVNVITKTAGTIKQSELGLRAGSFDSQAGWVQHGANINGVDIGFTANVSRTDGHHPYIQRDGQTTQDTKAKTLVSYAPGNADFGWNNQDLRFSLAAGNWQMLADYMRHGDVQTGFTGGGIIDPLTRGNDSRASIALRYSNEHFGKNWGLNAELRYVDLGYDSANGFQENPPGYKATAAGAAYTSGVLNRWRSAERQSNAEISGVWSGLANHAIRIGAGQNTQDLYRVEQWVNKGTGPTGATLPANSPLVSLTNTAYAFAPKKARKDDYFFVQDSWKFAPAWELTAGVRHDRYSDFGSTTNPRLALVWQANERVVAKFLTGQGFRAPSYQELFSPTANARPNAALRPEQARTSEFSLSIAASKDLRLSANLFRFAQSNLISSASGQFQNAGDQVINGIELEAQWQATPTLRFSGNRSNRRQPDSVARQPFVPDQEAYLRADWSFLPGWNWNMQANWTGKRHPLSPPFGTDTRAPLDGDTLVDTTLRYTPSKAWEFAASIRNLANRDAREFTGASTPDHLPLPKRNAYAEIRFKF